MDMGQCPHKSPCPCNTYVIPMSLYKFMSSFVTKRHTHTHTHTHTPTHTPLMYKQKHSVMPEWEEVYERGRRKIVERQRDLHPHCSTDAAETDTLFMLFSCVCEIWNKNKAHMVSSELWDTVILSTHTALMTEADSLWSLTHWVTLTSCFMFRIRNDQDIKVVKALKTDSA